MADPRSSWRFPWVEFGIAALAPLAVVLFVWLMFYDKFHRIIFDDVYELIFFVGILASLWAQYFANIYFRTKELHIHMTSTLPGMNRELHFETAEIFVYGISLLLVIGSILTLDEFWKHLTWTLVYLILLALIDFLYWRRGEPRTSDSAGLCAAMKSRFEELFLKFDLAPILAILFAALFIPFMPVSSTSFLKMPSCHSQVDGAMGLCKFMCTPESLSFTRVELKCGGVDAVAWFDRVLFKESVANIFMSGVIGVLCLFTFFMLIVLVYGWESQERRQPK